MFECLRYPKLEYIIVYLSQKPRKEPPELKIFASKNSQYTHHNVDDQAKYNPFPDIWILQLLQYHDFQKWASAQALVTRPVTNFKLKANLLLG